MTPVARPGRALGWAALVAAWGCHGGTDGSSFQPGSSSGGALALEAGAFSPGSSSGAGGDGSSPLADNGSGTCVRSRACDPTCDELVENGRHEYVEPAPDDSSALPPANVASLFSGSPGPGGPCIVDPPDGALFPNNWVRPRIRFQPASAAQTLFQVRVHADRQKNDLVVYTRSRTWKIPRDVWAALAASTWGEKITVTVSAVGDAGGAPASSKVTFEIAPADANGSMIYWAAVGKNPGEAWLESFRVGDENVATALTVPQTRWSTARSESGQLSTRGASPGAIGCIGCHVAVPDRKSVVFLDDWPWDGVAARVDPGSTGNLPDWLTPGGRDALGMPWLGMFAFSPHVWNDLGQHVAVAAYQGESKFPSPLPAYLFPDGGGPQGLAPWGFQGSNEWDVSPASELAWIDLSSSAPAIAASGASPGGDQLSIAMAQNRGTSWGILARTGDPSGVASPTWSHSGDTIVYTSTNASQSGRMSKGVADLYSVPYAGKAGGAATPIRGASDAAYSEYYPAFSPDDTLVAYNRTPAADDMYYDPRSEVYVVPARGGTATRLAANDPPACAGVKSPGVTNSWPKWSPEYPSCNGRTYYWLVFSSTRDEVRFQTQDQVTSQLYLTAIVLDAERLVTYPAVHVWNQHRTAAVAPYAGQTQSNHTPQWEPIDLPVPPPPPAPPPPPQ
jgi:hypothetical protein